MGHRLLHSTTLSESVVTIGGEKQKQLSRAMIKAFFFRLRTSWCDAALCNLRSLRFYAVDVFLNTPECYLWNAEATEPNLERQLPRSSRLNFAPHGVDVPHRWSLLWSLNKIAVASMFEGIPGNPSVGARRNSLCGPQDSAQSSLGQMHAVFSNPCSESAIAGLMNTDLTQINARECLARISFNKSLG